MMINLSLIIPCYNESQNLPALFERLRTIFHKTTGLEIILVNNGSTDDTAEILDRELPKYEHAFIRSVLVPVNQGYGHGILAGLKAAKGTFLGWTHADLQTDPKDLLTAYQTILSAADPLRSFVRGRRVGRRLLDWGFTFGMSCIASLSLRTWLHDINAQPKLFHRTFFDTWSSPPSDFSLDLYVLFMAKQQRLLVQEIPVHYLPRVAGEAKGGGSLRGKWKLVIRTWKYIRMLRSSLKSHPNHEVQSDLNPRSRHAA